MVREVNNIREYKNTEVGRIPKSWQIYKLEEVCDFIGDGTHYTPEYVEGGIPFYSVENVTANDFENTKFITEREHQILTKRCNPQYGDILLTRIGTLGKTKYIDWDINASIYVSLALIRANEKVSSKYLYSYTKSKTFINDIQKRSLINATPQKINMNKIGDIPIPIPPLEEQKAIAKILFDIESLIDVLKSTINKKEKIIEGTIQELLTGNKRLSNFSNKWKITKVKEIANVSTGDKNTQDKIKNGRYPFFVRSSTVERINSYSFDGEAVLTAGDGVGTGKIFHYINGKFDFHQRVYKISDFNDIIDGYFFYLYFSNNFFKRIMAMTAKSSVDSVRKNMITEMEIKIPSLKEQFSISKIIKDMNSEIKVLKDKAEKYENIKRGMMQELFVGRRKLI